MPAEELLTTVGAAEKRHRVALDNAIKKSGISGPVQVHLTRGLADAMIAQFVTDNKHRHSCHVNGCANRYPRLLYW